MYSSETTNQFIELRSQNVSLERISQQLGINKSTAIDWQQRYKPQIDEIKAVHLEAIRERLTIRYEDELEYAMSELKRIRAELKTRDVDYEPTAFLHYAEAAAYRRVQKLCALADFPSISAKPEPEIQNPSVQSVPGVCAPILSCPLGATRAHSLSSVTEEQHSGSTKEPQNPTEIQPFSHQNNGGGPPPDGRDATPIILPDNHFVNPPSQPD